MSAIRSFVRREPVLFIAALAALVTCFFVPPDGSYLSIDTNPFDVDDSGVFIPVPSRLYSDFGAQFFRNDGDHPV